MAYKPARIAWRRPPPPPHALWTPPAPPRCRCRIGKAGRAGSRAGSRRTGWQIGCSGSVCLPVKCIRCVKTLGTRRTRASHLGPACIVTPTRARPHPRTSPPPPGLEVGWRLRGTSKLQRAPSLRSEGVLLLHSIAVLCPPGTVGHGPRGPTGFPSTVASTALPGMPCRRRHPVLRAVCCLPLPGCCSQLGPTSVCESKDAVGGRVGAPSLRNDAQARS